MSENELITMKVTGLAVDPVTSMPFIILKNDGENVAIPIWIGMLEATAIASKLENVEFSRPMTHDLFKNILEQLHAAMESAVISELKENTFYAKLCLLAGGKKLEIDCRPSDAIALALRFDVPILVAKEVVDKSRSIDLANVKDQKAEKDRFAEILEQMNPEDFGKYKM